MARAKRNLTLPEDVNALLERVGNVSEYLAKVITQRWREWTEALATLRAADWTSAELCAACDVLNGYWLVGHGRSGEFVAGELEDGQRLNDICAKWDVSPKKWAQRVQQVATRPEIAIALVTLVEEFWTGNEACEAAIRREERA